MAFKDVNDPAAVCRAMNEFDEIGRDAFLEKYGFGKARGYFLVVEDNRYDSKAIFGAAHGYQFPNLGPLSYEHFSGGAATVERKLEAMGFQIERPRDETTAIDGHVSELLKVGEVYTRENLRSILKNQDATINTGVFRPAGFRSVLLFVTRTKTSDRIQYVDTLDGDTLHWQGQSAGRTDAVIIEHESRGLELLVFYRERKYEYPGAAFRYEGPFEYVFHTGALPANFTLRRASTEITRAQNEAYAEGAFDPLSIEDARKRTLAAIVRRQGQPAFREKLLRAYGNRCAITGCGLVQVLEAAHIFPYQGQGTNHVSNGLLLRADLHTLFDLHLIAVDPETMTLVVAPVLLATSYALHQGQALLLPPKTSEHPNKAALGLHYEKTGFALVDGGPRGRPEQR